jgi:hypothetical protein
MRFLSWLDGLNFNSVRRRTQRGQPLNPRRKTAGGKLSVEALEDRSMPSFLTPVNYAAGTNPQAIVTADFNGDGRLDLAVANSSSSNVSVLLGNGDGTFQLAQNSATGAGPKSLAVGDFNADGKLDLATANNYDVSVLLGNGNGSFGAASNIGVVGNPASVAVGDFNGDGKLDLGVASSVYVPPQPGDPYYGGGSDAYYQSYANVLLGNGTGTLTFTSSTATGGDVYYWWYSQPPTYTAAVADLNGDGRGDFISTDSLSYYSSVLLANLNGTLGYATGWAIGSNSRAVLARDVNGDGKADLVAGNNDGVAVRLGNGLGSFGALQTYAMDSQPVSLAVADFNGDGTVDLVTGNGSAGTVSVLLGTGAGAFKPPLNSPGGSYPIGVAVGDFNGDGRSDVATANLDDTASVLLNDGAWLSLDAPSITINDATVTEGNTGTTAATFTVSLSAAYGQSVSIHYATADGSATVAGGDYQAASGALTFAPGETSKIITVLVNGDRDYEGQESFFVRLSNPTNAFVADATGVGTILDDEPSISIEPYVSGAEGNTGTTAFLFTVTLSAAYDVPVTVDYATADLTADEQYWYGLGATAGVDYTAISGTLTIPAGQTSGTITVLVNGDRVGEYDESFFVNLSNATYAQLASTQSLGTIVNDEPYVSIAGGTVVEGNTGTKPMTFTVTLSAAYDAAVTVSYATADGSATAGSDYQAASGTLTIPAGQTSGMITVLVNGDRLGEYDEYFNVNLTGATGAVTNNSTGYGTIQDDEPRISINSASVKEGNSGTTVMTFTVTLSAAYDQTVTVNYATHDSSATVADNDYVATSGTLTFAAGQTTKTFTVTIKGDKKKEADESFYVLLSGASSNALISNAYGWGTILNDDGSQGGGNRK